MVQLITILNILDPHVATTLYIETNEGLIREFDLADPKDNERLDDYKTNYIDSLTAAGPNKISVKLK